jgi:TRAP-type C4-dicarboxylate transport system permease small subunit
MPPDRPGTAGAAAPAVRRLVDGLAALTRVAIFVLAVTMLLALTLQVFMRFVVGNPLAWSEEVALTCFSWAMLLAIALGVREGIHVRMDLFTERLPPAGRRFLERAVALGVVAFGFALAWAGGRYVLDSLGTTSAAIGFPVGWLYASAPVCGTLVVVFGLEQALFGRAPAAAP